jgi:DNA repair exonuclease SbcCD ATPase subunit
MKINKVKINNFYSFQDSEVVFDDYSGLVLIEGKNKDTGGSNGSGKSSMIEAVVWGLFGKTIRKSTEEAMVNFGNKKNCQVELTINDNIRIIRTRRPTFLEFFVGKDNYTKESVSATQEAIEKHLNTNYKLFLASMVFGQNNNLDFVSATPEEKRTIIKNFLNLDDLFNKRDIIKNKKSIYSTEVKTIDALATEYAMMIAKDTEKIIEIESGESPFLSSNNVTEEMLTKYSLDDILVMEAKIKADEDLLQGLYREQKWADAELQGKLKELEFLNKNKDKPIICKECGSTNKIDATSKIDEITRQIKLLDAKTAKRTNTITDKEKQIQAQRALIPIPSSKYKLILTWQDRLAKKEHLLENRKNHEEKLKELSAKRVTFSKKHEVMKFWEVAFSEQGLVKYIIKNIIDYFNDSCNEYLTHLTGGKYRIKFNEMLEETVYIGNKETKFDSLSGGEVKKINIAVLLGLQSLLTLTDKDLSNIIFFDEIAESLDTESLQGLYILLQNLKKSKTLFIITHNNDLKNLIDTPTIITVTKRNGVSTINKKDKVRRKQNVSS